MAANSNEPGITIKFNGLDAVRRQSPALLQEGLDAVGLLILQRAKYHVVGVDAVDTGALLNSIYFESARVHEGRETAIQAAETAASQPGKHSGMPHDFTAGVPSQLTGKLWAKVAVAAEYGWYVEAGTGRMAPRPFLTPAAQEARREARTIIFRVFQLGLQRLLRSRRQV